MLLFLLAGTPRIPHRVELSRGTNVECAVDGSTHRGVYYLVMVLGGVFLRGG